MSESRLRLIEKYEGFLPKSEVSRIAPYTRGIYALLKNKGLSKFDVVYIGMAGGEKAGIRGRIRNHRRKKGKLWTHFSVFKVWDNISEEEIRELEGLFRHIYSKDTKANRINHQRTFKQLLKLESPLTKMIIKKESRIKS
jgi:hypothetical protein